LLVRIAVVVSFFPSVSQTFVLSQITGLLDRGHEVDIYAAGPEAGSPTRAEHAEVERYQLMKRVRYTPWMPTHPLRRAADAAWVLAHHYRRAPRAAIRAVARARAAAGMAPVELLYQGAPFAGRTTYDAILCHFGPNGQRLVQLRDAGLVRGPIFTAFHGYDVSRYIRLHGSRVYETLFARGDRFLPVSDFWRRRLIALGCPAERITVHRMGIDLGKFAFAPRCLEGSGSTVRMLTVARLVEKKGVEYAVRAVAALRTAMRGGASGATGPVGLDYVIVGDGPLRSSLEQLVAELGAGDIIHLVGERDQRAVAAAMRKAHLFLAPSVTAEDGDMEGVPVSMMEAMACGMPVVSTYHSGIPELVRDGVSGFLVPERDAEALTLVLRHLVEHPERWGEIGREGRRTVEREHDVAKLNDWLVAVLGRSGGEGEGGGERRKLPEADRAAASRGAEAVPATPQSQAGPSWHISP
jgi:colanic acid/amylovoran biosynthesis glycosyltransferase